MNPIPSNLKSEAKKAAKILREFTEISSRNGPDVIIPGWSAPSAIGIAGLGGGFEIGIEVSDLVIILNQKRAVDAFAKGGNLTLGGNFTVAIGPIGRNLEGDVAVRSSAAVYTYCKSRGLFAGISLEGSCLIERKETNRKFYCQDIRACSILYGDVEPPAVTQELYDILDTFTEQYQKEEQRGNKRKVSRAQTKAKESQKSSPRPQRTSVNGGLGEHNPTSSLYPDLPRYQNESPWEMPSIVTAIHSFEGQAPGDLSFQAGDKITVTSRTNSQFDWWEGKLRGNGGIFPANYTSISQDY
ncbi:SH3 domain-containing YSC84-like protein 1 isoform X2 [Carcharodon carcharias]|uniref:SH3 domain-containing YSC84-like protein 1 isoform X2 n=1 Tax=Carcharodon carcharias TaxID=13397 RepID=UPI001B7F20B5|nr:SH3 domain-containing YSC84-like protein 1 isoform X2 [Carcharodon carcharias]